MMEEKLLAVISQEEEKQMDLFLSVIHAAEIIDAIYGEISMTSVIEECLCDDEKHYTLDEIQNAFVILSEKHLLLM